MIKFNKFLEYDPFTGISEHFYQDGNKISIHKTGDAGARFEQNNIEKLNAKSGWKESFHKVATIEPILIEQWRMELELKGADDCNPLSKRNRPFLMAKLNNRDYSKLRTKEGHL